MRRGQTNKTLALFSLACLAAGEYLRQQWHMYPWTFKVAYAVGAVCLVWLAYRLWKLAAPPPEIPDKPVPTAIKGLLPWVVGDGRLFGRLGRRAELESLLGLAQDEQTPIIVVRGESGSGKTSLLQAGLRYALGVESCVYWEALPDNPSGALLHAIQSRFPEIESLDALPSASMSRWVLILDQFEQLRVDQPDHLPVFQLLERIANEPAPHRLSVVVGFRREYTADWLDFEQGSGFRAEQVAVNLLPKSIAGDVMATIASQAGFTLEQALVDNFVSTVAQPRGISPLDLSVGLESLANFARQRGREQVTVRDYQLVGEAEGLLLVFVQQKLEEIPAAMSGPLLTGIVLTLVDLANNQRVAAGDTAAAIAAKAEVPQNQLRPWLDRLALPRVRLLEQMGHDRYRLPHERLVPVLRRLSGTELALLDQRRLLFESEYQRWKQTANRRHLLGGKDLTEVLANRDQIVRGDDSGMRAEYLDACIGRRRVLRLLGTGATVAAMGALYGGYRVQDSTIQRRALASWQLPPDLFTKQYQIDGLDLGQTINDLDWLRSRRLREFSCHFRGENAAKFDRLTGLTKLGIENQDLYLANLKLPPNLISLSLLAYGFELQQLAKLRWPQHLTSLYLNLSMSADHKLTDLKLPSNLTFLSLGEFEDVSERLTDLQLPRALKSLELTFDVGEMTNVLGLAMLQQLTSLGLKPVGPGLPKQTDLKWPRNLTKLSLASVGEEVDLTKLNLPQSLTWLELAVSKIPDSAANWKWPPGLTSLSLRAGLSDITTDLSDFQWPPNITDLSLDLSFSNSVKFGELNELKKLTSLEVRVPEKSVSTVCQLNLSKKTTLWVDIRGLAIPELPTGFKFLGVRILP